MAQRMKQIEMQVGKKGLTEDFLADLKRRFDDAWNIKIHVLKNARENKDDVKKIAQEIQSFLGDKFTNKTLGFSIFLKKWRRAVSREVK